MFAVLPGGPGGQSGRSAAGNEGIVRTPAEADGQWHTITITPQDDLAAIFPDLDSRDFGLYAITLNAVTTGDNVQGYFDYLRFNRAISGEVAYQAQASMMTALAGKYPGVRQHQGLELSSEVTNPVPARQLVRPQARSPRARGLSAPGSGYDYLAKIAIPLIHQGGGLASYNHPFGVLFGPLLSRGKRQHQALVRVAKVMLGNKALGADLLEVGYPLRGQVNLARHVGTVGCHVPQRPVPDRERDRRQPRRHGLATRHRQRQQQLRYRRLGCLARPIGPAGRAGRRPGLVRLTVRVRPARRGHPGPGSRRHLPDGLRIGVEGDLAAGDPDRSRAAIRGQAAAAAGSVDYPGTADPAPDTKMIASYTAAQLNASHQVTQAVDTSADSFVRTQVLDSAGTVVAMSNPLWLFQNPPPNGIPPPRRV